MCEPFWKQIVAPVKPSNAGAYYERQGLSVRSDPLLMSNQSMKQTPVSLEMKEEDTIDMLGRKKEVSTKENTRYLTPKLGSIDKDTFSVRKL